MKTYTFVFEVIGYIEIDVEAVDFEKAKIIARNEICNIDCGLLENIDSEIIDVY